MSTVTEKSKMGVVGSEGEEKFQTSRYKSWGCCLQHWEQEKIHFYKFSILQNTNTT